MSEQQTQAASSPADDVFQGQQPTMAEFTAWRQSGEVPERFKPAVNDADAATADAPEETVVVESESASDTDTEDDAQEPPQKGSPAEKRIKQLLAKVKELERNQQATAKPDAKTEPSTAQAQQPQTNSKPSMDDKDDKGNLKYSTFEEYNEALIDWKAEEKIQRYKQEQAQQQAQKALQAQFDAARTRYEDADEVIIPTAQAINDANIPPAIKEVFGQSEYLPDLCYVIGNDPAELKKFVTLAQTNPRAALAQVFEYERGIAEELAKASKEAKEPESGKAPEKKVTQAPPPPKPVTGGSSRGFDVSDESLSADDWMRKRTAQVERRKG